MSQSKQDELRHRAEGMLSGKEHDEVGQVLTYASLLADKMSRKPDEKVASELKSSIREAIREIRTLSASLAPRLLRSAGLLDALRSLFTEFTGRTQVNVDFQCGEDIGELPDEVALAGYRIVQESLTNIARHSGANEVVVRLTREPDRLSLEIADNGSGFDVSAVKSSVGLTGMKERALALGGELTIISSPGKGTRILAELPLPGEENKGCSQHD